MRSVGLSVVLALALVACGPPGEVFRTTILTRAGDLPLQVALGDKTGLVLGLEPAEFDREDFRDAGILADRADPNAFVLTWLGGMCDSDTVLVFWPTDSGYNVDIAIHEKLGLGCPAMGIFRGVRIETSEPIQPETITISGSATIELRREEDCGALNDAATNDAKVACGVLIEATVGERVDMFARVTVRPEDGACPGKECSTAEGIEARAWLVEATDRSGQAHRWRCTYRDETASCVPTQEPSPS